VLRNELCYARWDRYPVNPGHLLIIPFRHVADYFNLTSQEDEAVRSLLTLGRKLLVERHTPNGFNVGVNIGEAGGQTVWHVHVHLIPRYKGDIDNPRGGVRGVIPGKRIY
jgi:diadenosine tetraphosphate (Ap4A) HIT family hydrolase